MAEYVELIDKYRINYYDSPHSDYAPPSYEWVDNTGEVIRCRDCKEYYFADNRVPEEQAWVCSFLGRVMRPDDFCSLGERKGGDADGDEKD